MDDIRSAARELKRPTDIHVVFPPTLARTIRQNPDIYPLFKKAKGRWTTKEYLASFIKDELQTYLKKLVDQQPKFYIDPRVETPSSIPRKIPNPLRSFLYDPEAPSQSQGGRGRLAIVLAEPGQGKTYMSRHLVSELARANTGIIPLMVDSSQWQTLSLEDQGSLSKTIAHSFRHFDSPIGWLEGHEEEFLQATLKADIFRIVFDGFDEYILRNRGLVQPLEVLQALATLASATGTRIIITSRTSFWYTNLPDAAVEEFIANTGALVYVIQPFEPEQAKNYFSSRLGDQRQQNYASETYSALLKDNRELIGRGFVLSLIADLAERTVELGQTTAPLESNALLWLMDALCEREWLRQKLPFSAKEQISVLRTLATEKAIGATANTELLQLAMAEVRPSLDAASLQDAIEKFKSHPLLEKSRAEDVWRFKQEQIGIVLVATQLVDWSRDRIGRFIAKATFEAGARQDVGSTIVDLVKGRRKEDETVARLQEICTDLRSVYEGARAPADEGRRLAAVVALIAVERFRPKGSTHQERTASLLAVCGPEIAGLAFAGTIARHDFSDVSFSGCRFERVTWANCKFNRNTLFRFCHFIGGIPPAHCSGFGTVTLIDCRLDPEADAIFNSARVKEGQRRYSVDDLRNDMASVLNKFIIKGGIGLKTITEDNLGKGSVGASRHRDDILEVLGALVLMKHTISGGVSGYNVREDAIEAVKFYAANNVFTGRVREAFERLQDRLALT
jgi:hypothetical protein